MSSVLILPQYPPNIDLIKAHFPLKKGVIFTYDGIIYAPHGINLAESLIEHEKVHIRQQGKDPAAWWDKYIFDPVWRLEQELEAHRVEWRSFCKQVFNREKRTAFMVEIATRLSSSLYGSLITLPEAIKKIRN